MGEIERILQCRGNSYKVLDLPENSTKEQVKRKYKKLAVKIHPDRNADPKASDAFIVLTKAYEDIVEDRPKTINPNMFRQREGRGNVSQEDFEEIIKWYMHTAMGGGNFTMGGSRGNFGMFGGRSFRRPPPPEIEISNKLAIVFLVGLFLFSLLR